MSDESGGTTLVSVALSPAELERLNAYRRAQSDPPSRPKAVKELALRALAQREAGTAGCAA
jgi:hypothetical protein